MSCCTCWKAGAKSLESVKSLPPVSEASVPSVSWEPKLELSWDCMDAPLYAPVPRRLPWEASPTGLRACRPRTSTAYIAVSSLTHSLLAERMLASFSMPCLVRPPEKYNMLFFCSTFAIDLHIVRMAYNWRSVLRALNSLSSAVKLEESSEESVLPLPSAKPELSVPSYLLTAASRACLSLVKSWSMLRLETRLTDAARSAGAIL